MSFITEYLKHPRSIGAIAPSGKNLAKKMMQPIDFDAAKVIVEYGPGTGSFTKELIARRNEKTTLIIIERNDTFYEQLKKELSGQKNLHLIHGSAENVVKYLDKYGFRHADYIISGLPFSSLPKQISSNILEATQIAIGKNGQFITFQYSLVKKKLFEKYFTIIKCPRVMRNLPPAFVFVMENKK